MPSVKSLTSKRLARHFKLVAVILSLGKIMSTYSYYTEKGLICIIIIAPLGRQPSSYAKYTKLNMYFTYNIKYIFLTRFYTL